MNDEVHRSLQTSAADRAQATLRSIASTIDVIAPGLGSIFGELVGVILPANREERMAVFLTSLDRSVRSLGAQLEDLYKNLNTEQLALFEDGLRSSSRATQEARIDRIGVIVATGFVEADRAVRQREILELMGQLSDSNLKRLSQFTNPRGFDTYRAPMMTMGDWKNLTEAEKSQLDENDRMRDLSLNKLVSMGFIERKYGINSDPLHPSHVTVEEQENRLTELGYFFCLHVGMWPNGDRPYLS